MKNYTLGLYEKAMPKELGWKEKLLAAKEAGYDFVEISIDETDEKLARLDMPKEERLELIRMMAETGVPLRTMCLSGHRKYPLGSSDPDTCRRGMEIMEKAIRLSEDLGIRIIQLAGYDVYYEQSSYDTKARFAENLEKSVQMAARAGIVMGFETMETEFMNTVEKAMHYVRRMNSPYLNVYPDSGNITNAAVSYQTDVLEDLRSGAGHLAAMHLKETVPGVFREVPYGTGHVDFESLVHTAWELGVRRFVTEFWYTGSPDWKKDLHEARAMMGALLDAEREKEVTRTA
ncbi:MAG: L-ribulose-5-phosphate 3-epimerase [Lachnospiraceae bacterium]|nr:L-ribulose-5-phosphate 3-epimerase [Lachnospiraceae bacterium]